MRTLVAGVGNVLRGDDGFGVRVAERLAGAALPPGTRLVEVGISGLALVHELMAGYDACVLVDVAERGAEPGTVELVELPPASLEELEAGDLDVHRLEPSRALRLAQALGVRPARCYLVACQPACVDELCEELSEPVARAIDRAVELVRELVA